MYISSPDITHAILVSSAFMNLAAKFPNQIITGKHTEHTINWDAVRTAEHSKISKAIDKRGMNNRIAKRIQVIKIIKKSMCIY